MQRVRGLGLGGSATATGPSRSDRHDTMRLTLHPNAERLLSRGSLRRAQANSDNLHRPQGAPRNAGTDWAWLFSKLLTRERTTKDNQPQVLRLTFLGRDGVFIRSFGYYAR